MSGKVNEISEFGMHQQTDLVELSTIHNCSVLLLFCFIFSSARASRKSRRERPYACGALNMCTYLWGSGDTESGQTAASENRAS